ncbi:hypothetical protein CN445_12345 [Bacillus cereus]|nr:hypothetical protein bcere0029_58870 [Bacillus cereus AH1272]EEL90662.1 hypothetical protein bcere0030_53900 [Bacillus cereus AH1273]PEW87792.1 hypothetical protein CN445_12345 [Bacillus cereus]PFN72901.1 hypothetical protein COJ62_17665 [Bacillus cereus]
MIGKGMGSMHIFFSSSHTLFLDLLKLAFKQKRPDWLITAHISLIDLKQEIIGTITKEIYNIIVIETSYEKINHFAHHIEVLRELEIPTIFLVDEHIGEVYHHTKETPHFHVLHKNISLNQFIKMIEKNDFSNCYNSKETSLTDFEEQLLLELSKGHSVKYIHDVEKIPYAKIEEAIEHINRYFNTSHYLQAVYKAHAQNYFQKRHFK